MQGCDVIVHSTFAPTSTVLLHACLCLRSRLSPRKGFAEGSTSEMSHFTIQSFAPMLPTLQYLRLENNDNDNVRSGEGSVVELTNGDLLLLFTHFEGTADHSPAVLAKRTSSDGGLTWSPRETVFAPPESAQNCMSVSLIRLPRGAIGCLFMTKWSTHRCLPTWSVSQDEGQTWSTPRPVLDEEVYMVINNDRLVALADGTVAFPYALHQPFENDDVTTCGFNPAWNATCGVFYSRDDGETWVRSRHTITHTPAVFRPPLHCNYDKLDETGRYIQDNHLGVFQEPGLIQLSNGRVMMYMRSLHGIYRCFATSIAEAWEDCDVVEGFHVCCSPQTIKRMPATGHLIMLYNDKGTIPLGEREFHARSPLSVATSDDNGASWQRWGELEPAPTTYCYYSLLFFQNRFLISYYESGIEKLQPNGRMGRRALASLKLCFGDERVFEKSAG